MRYAGLSHVLILMFFIFVSAIFLRSLIFSAGLIYHSDASFPPDDYSLVRELKLAPYVWNSDYSGGAPWGMLIWERFSLLLFLRFMVGSMENAVKTFYVLLLAVVGFNMYIASYRLSHKKAGSFFGGILYMLNPWSLANLLDGHMEMMLGYACVPLTFSFMISAFSQKPIRTRVSGMVFSAFFAGLSIMFDTKNILISLILIGSYSLFILISELAKTDFKNLISYEVLKKYVVPFITIIVVFFAVDAFELLPINLAFSSFNPFYPDSDFVRGENTLSNMLDSFRQSSYVQNRFHDLLVRSLSGHYFWLYDLWFFLGLMLTALIFSVILIKKEKFSLYLVFLALVGVFLCNGANPPLGFIFSFLNTNVPYFRIYKGVYHFGPIVSLPYALLFALLFDLCFERAWKIRRFGEIKGISFSKLFRTIIFTPTRFFTQFKRSYLMTLSLVLLASQVMPVFLVSDLRHISRDANYSSVQTISFPQEFIDLRDFLEQQPEEYRVALFPPGHSGSYSWSPTPIYEPLTNYPVKPTIYPLGEREDSLSNDMIWWTYHTFYQNRTMFANRLFGTLGVKWFVIREDFIPGGPASYFRRHTETMNLMNNQEGLDLIFHEGLYSVYEVDSTLPLVSASDSLILAVGDRRIMSSLSYSNVPFSWLKERPIIFVDNLDLQSLEKILPLTDYVIIQQGHFNDIIFNAIDKKYVLNSALFLSRERNYEKHWVYDAFLTSHGYPGDLDAEIDSSAFAQGANVELSLSFTTEATGEYELWLNAFAGGYIGNLTIILDNSTMFFTNLVQHQYEQVKEYSGKGFVWTKLGDINLSEGTHSVILRNSNGINIVSKIAIAPTEIINYIRTYIIHLLSAYDITPIYLIEGEHMDTINSTNVYVMGENNGYRVSKISNGEIMLGAFPKEREAYTPLASTNIFAIQEGLYTIRLRATVVPNRITVNGENIITGFYKPGFLSLLTPWRNAVEFPFSNIFIGPILLKRGVNTLEIYDWFGVSIIDYAMIYPYIEETSQNFDWIYDFSNMTDWQFAGAMIYNNTGRGVSYDFSADGTLNIWMISYTNITSYPQYVSLSYDDLNINTFDMPFFETCLEASKNARSIAFYFFDDSGKEIGQVYSNYNGNPKVMTWDLMEILGNTTINQLQIELSYFPLENSSLATKNSEKVWASINYIAFNRQTNREFIISDYEEASPKIVDYKRESNVLVSATVKSNSSFLLVFNENFDPQWHAFSAYGEVEPIAAWSWCNAFIINHSSPISKEVTVQIRYMGQRYFYVGATISVATFTAIFAIEIWTMLSKFQIKIQIRYGRQRRMGQNKTINKSSADH